VQIIIDDECVIVMPESKGVFIACDPFIPVCVSYRWVRTAPLKFYALQPFVHRQVERDKVSFLSGKFSNLISPSELLPPSTFPSTFPNVILALDMNVMIKC
jgi:hypothetical protein